MIKPPPYTKWFNYPALAEGCYQVIELLAVKDQFRAEVYVGRQEDFWVTGYKIRVGNDEGNSITGVAYKQECSRKHGEHTSYDKAVLAAVVKVQNAFIELRLKYPKYPVDLGAAIRLLEIKRQQLEAKQLKLF